MTVVELCVHMDCSGCEARIKKALYKIKGVSAVDTDMAMQKVTVTGWVDQKKILKAVRKTGRSVVLYPSTLGSTYSDHQVQQPTPIDHLIFNVDTNSYNYYKHGYGDSSLYAHKLTEHTRIIDDEVRVHFSDDNPTSCSIM
ncbi:heavy metal-associated isoprenylated plant protein 20-like [Canna indica]|uniref:Heavy metal-associated isoprenylated plant protein 20-like n=1 Tax=Canna indica TaxID=4628 RepID=A0AAQ3K5A3_9LILI|nr:heavy metal-associated isoprenylated plant protein 20-like [Canna indica]